MPTIRLEISDALAESLDTERELLGFDSREAYLRWIVDHRTDIEVGSDRDQVLSAFTQRVEELEAKLDEGVDAATVLDESDSTRQGTLTRGSAEDNDGESEGPIREPRTARIQDDTVNELATDLSGVENERLDAFARSAVRKTGELFDGSPESGIDYELPTDLDDGDRPGEAITDLDAIEVPGHDETLIERRKIAVGAALVFLREREEAKRNEFVNALYREYPAGYETSETWWDCVKDGLRQIDRVHPAREGRRVWRFNTTPGRVTRLPSRD
ncbi:hypothetical protein [Natranaeroarchaeum sulfidigenes]|uniref:Uncharacterized protein n=1 Tax=Natranaeroarchaeum sulfidigenes TaxID=2784880 RepID=A0A897MUG6_9EURY|nr:hypothetical protein [Natranaeroarchaeum sulfidigenes]QSG04117.1 Uncharacterized protein AArcS_2929 [Natranaeroarchaeum sulfidigenes]